ncbi:MAG: hypothetical protein IKW03_01765 [Clostridia bacterium]|nr:hypothetical protein [Clostridia bacterium]
MKNSLKKAISVLLCLMMVLTMGVIGVSAEEADFSVRTDCNGECEFYPTIIVPGLGQSNTWLADENGVLLTDDAGNYITSFPAYVQTDKLIKTLALPALKSLFTQSDAGLSEAAKQAVWDAFGHQACDENAMPSDRIVTEKYLQSTADTPDFGQTEVFGHVPFNLYDTKQPFDHMYYFAYSSFGNHLQLVDELYEFIQMVKAQTGHDKVNLVPLSQGGTLFSGLIEYYPEVVNELHKIILVVPALDGSTIIGDAFNGRFSIDDPDFLYNGFLENLGLLDEFTARLIEVALRILPDEVIMKVVNAALSTLVEDVMTTSTNMWVLCPSADYPTAAEKYLSTPERAEIRRQTDIYYQTQLHAKDNILNLVENGVQVFCFCEYNTPMIDVGATWNTQNADFIIQTDSTSMGAYFANCGETLPEDYVQKNTYCSDPTHNHISPDRVVDASAGLLPDQTFYFDGQRHDLTALNDIILKLALNLIECDDIKDVYSLPEFPQFNIGRITSNVRIYMNQVKELDTAGMSAAEIAEKDAAVAEAEALLDTTTGEHGEAEACEARLIDVLVRAGEMEAPAAEKDPTMFRKLSLWLYENYGTNGFSEMYSMTAKNMFKK